MAVTFSNWQRMKSPRRQGSHVKQCPPCQPTPTRWPAFQLATSAPTVSIRPAISWPGTRGYCRPGQSPSLTMTSLWQTPHASTLMRTCPRPGSGIGRSTSSRAPPGLLTCTAFMSGMFVLRQYPGQVYLMTAKCSDLRHAAVHEELDPADEAAVVRGEEEHGLRDLIWAAHAAKRHGVDDLLLEVLDLLPGQPQIVVARRVDRSGADGVNADPALLEVDGPGAREGADGGLGRAVDTEGLHPLRSGDRRVQDDRAAIPEERQGLLHREEESLDVDAEGPVEVRLGDRPERRELAGSGVGEEDVDAALFLLHHGVQAIEVGELRDVALDGGGVRADLPRRHVELGLTAPGDEDVSALLGEPLGGGEADSAIAPGDDRDFPLQSLRHGVLLPGPKSWAFCYFGLADARDGFRSKKEAAHVGHLSRGPPLTGTACGVSSRGESAS